MPHHVEVHLSTLAQLLPTTSTRRAPQLQTLCNSPPPVKSSTRKHRQLRPAGMKLLLPVLATVAVVSWSPAAALEAASLHLRVYEEKDASCTITNESQCDGQNWTGSTCCADSSYECRWDDYGQNVKRCQKIAGGGGGGGGGGGSNNNACTITNESQCDGQNWTGSTCCADSSYECRWDDYGQNVKRCQKKVVQDDSTPASNSDSYSAESDSDSSFSDSDSYFSDSESYSADSDSDSGSKPLYISDSDSGSDCDGCGIIWVDDWADCTDANKYCENDTSWCIYHSEYYAQCKPETLPSGELCGQSDGTNEWLYDYCPSGESCEQQGTDYRCTKTTSKHHKMSTYTYVDDWGNCLAPNTKCKGSSQCVKYSPYYAQCKPATLPAGELCGQNDGTNVWKYDHCPAGQTCKQNGSDFRCTKTTSQHKKNVDNQKYHVYVENGAECTDQEHVICNSGTCVKHSTGYWQCMPTTLAAGALCGQKDGTNNWKYNHCPSGQTCKKSGTSYYCTGSSTTTYTYVDDWGNCLASNTKCKGSSQCVKYSAYYAQCKPATLPSGELCGQNDGTNVWKYDHCTAGETCKQNGNDFRCTKSRKHHKMSTYTYVDDWGNCLAPNTKCKGSSQCVKYSPYYAQCKPATLPAGELCGQNDGTNVWKYDHCPAGQSCKQNGTDFRCTKTTSKHHKMSSYTYVDDWAACTPPNFKCKGTSVCVKYSQYYSQCKPATLPQGELCGQNDGTNVWKYDHCPAGQKCKQNGTDFRCS